jgi:hypothetical protein
VRDVARREHGVASRQMKLLPADFKSICVPLPFWSECIARNDLSDQHSRPDAECYFTNRCLAENALN